MQLIVLQRLFLILKTESQAPQNIRNQQLPYLSYQYACCLSQFFQLALQNHICILTPQTILKCNAALFVQPIKQFIESLWEFREPGVMGSHQHLSVLLIAITVLLIAIKRLHDG